jgi:TatD DNase family protein
LLASYRHRLGPLVLHCFTGPSTELDAYLDLDLHIGITGWICDERRGLHLRELVTRIPLERLMLETDAPYLLPRDLEPRPRDRRNEPAFLSHIAARVASAYGLSPSELAKATSATAASFFRLSVVDTAD